MTTETVTTKELENLVLSVVLAHNVSGEPLEGREKLVAEAEKLREWVEAARFNVVLANLIASGKCCARIVNGDIGEIHLTEQAKLIVASLRASEVPE